MCVWGGPSGPGVGEGLARFLLSRPTGALAPFLLGFNKCMLCRPEDHSALLAWARGLEERRKESRFWGAAVVVLPQGWLTPFAANDRY